MLLEVFYLCGIKGKVEKVEEAVGFFSVSCKFKNVGNHFERAFSRVYGPNSNKKRHKMWEELIGLISW